MSPRTRQSLINFRIKKNITVSHKKHLDASDEELSPNSTLSDDEVPLAALHTPKRLSKSSSIKCLTPSSALATLSINSPKTPTYSAQKALHVASDELPCREAELNTLQDFLTDCATNLKPASMYISGLPGTGKTAALTKVMESKEISKHYMPIFVNCTAVKSSSAIYHHIAEALKAKLSSKSEKAAITAINKSIFFKKTSRKQKMILLVLDEIDQLESKFQSVLYTIFEWPSKANSRIVLIGIANAIDLTDRMLPRLQMLPLKPKLLHFQPYSKEQIITILKHRLQLANDSAFFAPGSLELISAKVAGQSGDLRRALDLGRRVLELTKAKTPQSVKNTPKKELFPTEKQKQASPSKTEKVAAQSNLRQTPRKSLIAQIDESPVISPRKRSNATLNSTLQEEVLRKTPRKTPAPETKENVCVRQSPRKLSEDSKTHSPCKELFPLQNPAKMAVVVRQSPRKLSDDSKTHSPCKELFPLQNSNKMAVCVRQSPRKLPDGRSPCKELFPLQSPAKMAVLLSSPRRSPRKHLFGASPTKAEKFSPRKQLFTSDDSPRKSPRKQVSIHAKDVMDVVSQMYRSAHTLRAEESAFPLHQKLLICSLLLILTKGKNKDVTIGKLHEVYGRVCNRRGISAVDQSGFISLCRQVEMAGAVEIGKGPGRLAKINLQWDEAEVSHALKDSSLLTAILSDTSVLTKK